MRTYEKELQFPVNIRKPDPAFAKIVISQISSPDGELAASMRYLNQCYTMPYDSICAMLMDIGMEELAHLKTVFVILYQPTGNLSAEEIKAGGFDAYYVDRTTGIWIQAASGAPFTAAYYQSKGDLLTDSFEDTTAEQKARTTYENLIRVASDPDVIAPPHFLRGREIVHLQRFGEALAYVRSQLGAENYYQCNPAFD